MATLAARVEKRLKALGLKRSVASLRAGLNATYVRDLIEERVKNPRVEHLTRLAAVLQTTPEWLKEARGAEELEPGSAELARAQALLAQIDPEDLPGAVKALRGFVREAPAKYAADPQPARRKPKKS